MNANNPQTPGVYTVEQNAFPNSVAQVPTAIPAFVGYTEFAVKDGKPLTTPLLINSLTEYAQHFGGGFENKYPISQVIPTKDANGVKTIPPYDFEVNDKYYKVGIPTSGNMFYLYNCLQLFYQNGGGPCYIMSIGAYYKEVETPEGDYTTEVNAPDKDAFLTGLDALPKIQFPKPTMILTPDSLLLDSSADYYTVQQQVLMQCGELMDRVGLIDVYNGYLGLDQGVISNHRNAIGNNYMSYGISYYPFLETTIVETSDMTYGNVDQSGNNVQLSSIFIGEQALAPLAAISADITQLLNLVLTPPLDFGNPLPSSLPTAISSSDIQYPSWTIAFNAFPSTDSSEDILKWELRVLFSMVWTLYELGQKKQLTEPKVALTNTTLINSIVTMTSTQSALVSLLTQLYAYDVNFAGGALGVITSSNMQKIGVTLTTTPTPASPYGTATTADEMFPLADATFKSMLTTFLKSYAQVSNTAQSLLQQYNTSLENSNAGYKSMMTAMAQHAGTLPPGPAMAGVYTLVDNSEGVWYAPANRNINSVNAPTVIINNDEQASLNVDALAGKSINAIRSFYGRGPAIIWGARTLDGNSMDWRYINVRRTMILIEQSVANAAQALVFQPNDASTWDNCESMIANFLHNLWTAGALQGASASDAYTVSIGLGKTMTSTDILNGVMRVQVKLALVRPAEFIIITYEQEMAKS